MAKLNFNELVLKAVAFHDVDPLQGSSSTMNPEEEVGNSFSGDDLNKFDEYEMEDELYPMTRQWSPMRFF